MNTSFSTTVIYADGQRSFYSPDGAGRVWAEAEGSDGVAELRENTGIEAVLRVSAERIDEMAGY